ncbi:hypothetical protein HMPREF9120_00527 [Neisseria sp. oral taxon 020 str. F0370]|nr:hypothetical protein HMPREF9120_00527 [Neisseria sp. oral taxon 020 str. F0370]
MKDRHHSYIISNFLIQAAASLPYFATNLLRCRRARHRQTKKAV